MHEVIVDDENEEGVQNSYKLMENEKVLSIKDLPKKDVVKMFDEIPQNHSTKLVLRHYYRVAIDETTIKTSFDMSGSIFDLDIVELNLDYNKSFDDSHINEKGAFHFMDNLVLGFDKRITNVIFDLRGYKPEFEVLENTDVIKDFNNTTQHVLLAIYQERFEEVQAQELLEAHDGASKRKDIIGLGQDRTEEVGSEIVLDKSKSIKTFLTQSFKGYGNTNIEGVDSTNSCYGGIAALCSCVNWVESSSWDVYCGLIVCTDSVVYAEGPTRPIEGAATIAIIVGSDAPIEF
ncbi:hypothetical protein ACH5RR_000710 [Cinchona calisaya]|uniref:Hydroxymethylglutaryl-coenzyme A synthase N-terminal domain-containing protein n=1 Tax=Cinchona calisaya TaxID=153742 RepID=A0ABD3B1G0_9GENT